MISSNTVESERSPFFTSRSIVVSPGDLSWREWPERAVQAGLNVLCIGPPNTEFIQSEQGRAILVQCERIGLEVEYNMHAMGMLLPRELFDKEPDLFRMDGQGLRQRDGNLCVHSERALEIAARNVAQLAGTFRPTTGRHYYWGDDGASWCRCPKCAKLSDSDQALIVELRLLKALRETDPKARLAHLVYQDTLAAPREIRPAEGIFLEFAPFQRRHDLPLDDPANRQQIESLDENLKVFGARDAKVLDYWLDVSLFSDWKKPAVRLPFRKEVLAADLEVYRSRGIRHVSSFAVFADADYVSRFGPPPIEEYGRQLLSG